MKNPLLIPMIIATLCIPTLTGCDQNQSPNNPTPTVQRKYPQATTLEGNVGNNSGIIKTGSVVVTDEQGHTITQAAIDNGHFQVEIPANTVLPILLTYTAESGPEKLVTAVIYDTVTRYYINPSTTAIAKAAKAMGGYTRANMDRATESSVHVPDANKTSTGWKGDPTKQYGGWH